MTHTCDDCGDTFETLTRLRLHDCPEAETDWREESERRMQEIRRKEQVENRRARGEASEALTDALHAAAEGDPGGGHRFLAHYERHLTEAWDDYEEDLYWGFHREFYERGVTALDGVVLAEGWSYLLDALDAYWPSTTPEFDGYADLSRRPREDRLDDYADFPHVSHVLTNLVGRHLIRTRLSDGVDAIPGEALDYQLPFHRHPGDVGAWVESDSYGWGIGHPDHPFGENVVALVTGGYDIWAGGALRHAIYADQYAAVDLLETVVASTDVSDPATLLQCVARVDRNYSPDTPQYWDWSAVPVAVGEEFRFDPEVRRRLRAVVADLGLDRDLSDDWSLGDLEL